MAIERPRLRVSLSIRSSQDSCIRGGVPERPVSDVDGNLSRAFCDYATPERARDSTLG